MHVRAGLVRLATFLRHRFPGHHPGIHGFPRRALAVAAGTVLASAGLAAIPAVQHATAATSTDAVTVNATSGLGTIPSGAIGLNTAVYDSDMNDAPIPGLLKAAGIDALRYPGGSYSDIYNWQTSTAADSGYVAPGTTFSDFMSTASSTGAQPIVYTLGNNATSITSATQSSSAPVTVAPYTLTVIQIPGSGGTGITAPGAPGQPTVSGLSSSTSGGTSGTATLAWPASTAGTYPLSSYRVYAEGSSGGSTLAGTTPGTSLTLTGLTVGGSYAYDVLAVDSQGNTSLPSPPVTFTVPPPANSSCAVHYAVSSSWPGGFGAAITITNKGTTAISPWTLTFTFPAAGETVQGGWNGTWSQTGRVVTVTAASWNSSIAANGGTVSTGFNGIDTGQDPAPTVLSVNGTACAND